MFDPVKLTRDFTLEAIQKVPMSNVNLMWAEAEGYVAGHKLYSDCPDFTPPILSYADWTRHLKGYTIRLPENL